MGSRIYQFLEMGLCFWVCLFSLSLVFMSSQSVGEDGLAEGTVFIDGKGAIGKIDDDFICATLDWWPPEKCDYGTCSWGQASLLNLVCVSRYIWFLDLLSNITCICSSMSNLVVFQ